MCCDGFISVPVIDEPVNQVLDTAKQVDDTVNNAIDNAGTAIDQTVRNDIPGGWATVGAVAATIATGGVAGAFDAATTGLDVAPELDATGSMASQAGTIADAVPTATPAVAESAPIVADTSSLTSGINLGGSTLGEGGSGLGLGSGTVSSGTGLGGLTDASTLPLGSSGINTGSAINAALSGAAKGALTNVAIDAITGQPITPQGLLTSATTGGVGGVAGNVAGQLGAGTIGSGIAGGTAGGTTGALLNNGNVGQGALTGALTGGVGGATNLATEGQDPSIASAEKSVASSLTNSLLSGQPLNTQNTLLGALGSAGLTSAYNALPSTTTTTNADNNNPDEAFNKALINAMQNPVDTSNNPTFAPLALNGTVTLTGDLIPKITTSSDVGGTSPLVASSDFSGPVSSSSDVGKIIQTNPDGSSVVKMPDGTINTYNEAGDLVSSNPPEQFVIAPSGNLPVSSSSATTPAVATTASSTPSVTLSNPSVDLTPVNSQLASLTAQQQAQAQALIDQGATTQQAIDAVQNNLQGQIGGVSKDVGNLNTGLTNLQGTVGGISGDISNLNTGLSNANTGIQSNTNAIQNLGTTVAQNQEATNQALTNLSDAQKQEVASQVAMGVSLTTAINNVQSGLTKQLTDYQNAQRQAQSLSNASAYANQAPLSVTGPPAITASELKASPVYGQNSQILAQLKQMYPQLAQMNPKLLNKLGLQAESPLQQVQKTQQTDKQTPQTYAPELSETKFADNYQTFKSGGLAHVPEFITGHTGHYASGKGDGQSDDIKALLNDGDYVIDAESVAQLGNGSSKAGKEVLEHFRASVPHSQHHASGGKVPAMIADGEYVLPSSFVASLGGGDGNVGAKKLDKMRLALREHKRSAPLNKIPPKSKSPLEYLRDGLKMKEKG